MRITVIGTGAVGGYFGGRLQDAGHDVTHIVRSRRRAQLEKTGLRIESPFGNTAVTPQLVASADEVEACDLVLLAVKNYHLDGAMADIKKLADKGAYILPLLNGIEHFDTIKAACGEDGVLGGVVQIISTLNDLGEVIHTNRLHHISFGPLLESQLPFCNSLVEASASANMVLHLSEDVMVDIWRKYAFITAFSGITTASRLPIDEVLTSPSTTRVYMEVLEEMFVLAAESGTRLPADFVMTTLAAMKQMPKGATSSMHQDFRKGLTIEVDSLQGAAVRLAKQLGTHVPHVETLYGLLMPYENGSVH